MYEREEGDVFMILLNILCLCQKVCMWMKKVFAVCCDVSMFVMVFLPSPVPVTLLLPVAAPTCTTYELVVINMVDLLLPPNRGTRFHADKQRAVATVING